MKKRYWLSKQGVRDRKVGGGYYYHEARDCGVIRKPEEATAISGAEVAKDGRRAYACLRCKAMK